MVAILVTKRNVSYAILVTTLTNLKLHLSKRIVHHVGKNMIIVCGVVSSNVQIVNRAISFKMESAIFVRVIAFHVTLLKIV